MKELSIEEKAKRYDEALEKSKRLYEQGTITESLCYVFPELKESEDERIRKNCIHFLELQKSHHAATFEIEECIAWLEKQHEQNEWNKEDETIVLSIKQIINCASLLNIVPEKLDRINKWLKSLKQRIKK